MIYLVRRNSDEAVDLAVISIPEHLRKNLAGEIATRKGVYGLTPGLREWLKRELFEERLAA
jgi:hypothetical protein